MLQNHNNSILLNKNQIFGLLALVLFFVTHNISSVFYQIRGVAPEQFALSVIAYYMGLLCSALALDALEQRTACSATARSLLRVGVPAILMFTSLFCLVSPALTEASFRGNRVLNTLQPFLWALFVPVAFRLFFQHVPPRSHGLFFGLAVGAGHLCWALLTPLVHSPEAVSVTASGVTVNSYLPFMNSARSIFGIGFAVVAALLFSQAGPAAPAVPPGRTAQPAAECPGRILPPVSFTPHLRYLLPPLALCFFLNGLLGYLFFARLRAHGMFPEYMHLGLMLFFPLMGLLCSRMGDRVLLYLLAAAAFAFTASPLLTVFLPESPWYQAIFLACSIGHQALVFGGTLVCGRFSITGAHPALTASSVWLCSGIAIPGMLLARAGLPDSGASPFIYMLALLALYMAGMRLLRRVFPLPMPDCHEDEYHALPKQRRSLTDLPLTARERDMMALAVQGKSNAGIAEEMGLALSTVGNTLSRAYAKLEVKNRAQAIQKWNEMQP